MSLDNKKLGMIVTSLANVGAYLRDNGHLDQAIECFEALAYGDDSYEVGDYAIELALCYDAKCELEKTRKFCRIAMKENPGKYASHPLVRKYLNL